MTAFLDDLVDVLDRVATLNAPVLLVGDVNIRLDRPTESDAKQFNEVLAAYSLANRVMAPTHNRGGLLDVVVARVDLSPPPSVAVLDVCLSDHLLLQWSLPLVQPLPVYTSTTSRPWSRLDVDAFCTRLQSSPLCRPDVWRRLDLDELAALMVTSSQRS